MLCEHKEGDGKTGQVKASVFVIRSSAIGQNAGFNSGKDLINNVLYVIFP